MASEIKVDTIVNAGGDNDSGIDLATNDNIKFNIAGSQKAIIDSSGNVGIGTSSPSVLLDLESTSPVIRFTDSDASGTPECEVSGAGGDLVLRADRDGEKSSSIIAFEVDGSEKARIDSSGNVLIGTTDDNPNNNNDNSTADNGIALFPTGLISIATHQNATMVLNRTGNDGSIMDFRRSGSTIGQINVEGGDLVIGSDDTALQFVESIESIRPFTVSTNSGRDNAIALGTSSQRFDDAFITNGVTTGSDQTEKQQIATLTNAEIASAKRISGAFKTFKWNHAVEEKGDKARIHTGVIAQEVKTALEAEGLDANKYAFFMSDTWWEKGKKTYHKKEEAPEGATERTRLGIRYPQLLSFINAATELRLASIEARLTALESK